MIECKDKYKVVEVFACCSKCKSIKPISYIPTCLCSSCNNRKFLSFYFAYKGRKYISNKKVRYRTIGKRIIRSIKIPIKIFNKQMVKEK